MKQADAQSRPRLFGTDGVRGTANVWPMTAEVAMQLGRALAFLIRNGSHRHRVVIGKDTRLSGYMLEQALAAGITSMGVDVELIGPLPTPGIANITTSMRADAGAVISASHNPYQDNGIKFFWRDGFKLPDQTEAELEELVASGQVDEIRPTADKVGKACPARRRPRPLHRLPQEHLSPRAHPGRAPDRGRLRARGCLPDRSRRPPGTGSHGHRLWRSSPTASTSTTASARCTPSTWRDAVVEHGAHLGLALDGDADRLIVADEQGRIVDGDAIMAVCTGELVARDRLRTRTLVTTVMSNVGLERAVARWGVRVLRTRVGDRYVVEEMRAGRATTWAASSPDT